MLQAVLVLTSVFFEETLKTSLLEYLNFVFEKFLAKQIKKSTALKEACNDIDRLKMDKPLNRT